MKKNKLFQLKTLNKYCFLIILLSVFVTLANLGFKYDFLGQDAGLLYNYKNILFKLTHYLWNDYYLPGKSNETIVFSFIWNYFIIFLHQINLSNLFIKRFLFFLFFVISGQGFMKLSRTVQIKICKSQPHHLSSFLATLFFMFNHYTMEMVAQPITAYHLVYMVLPWIVNQLIISLIDQNFLNVFLFTILSLITLNGNPSNTIIIILYLILWFIFLIISKQILLKKALRFIYKVLPFFLLIFSPMILPIISMGRNPYDASAHQSSSFNSYRFNSLNSTLPNLFRFAGVVSWKYYHYYDFYDSNFITIIGYLFILLMILGFFQKSKNKQIRFFLMSTLLFFLFFAKGSNQPLGLFTTKLFENISFFRAFRSVYLKFMHVAILSGSLLLMLFFNFFFEKNKKKIIFNKLTSYSFLLLIFIYNLPFFNGGVISARNLTKIPKEYISYDLKSGNILSLPPMPNGSSSILQWNDTYYHGPNPDMYFFNSPYLNSFYFFGEKYANLETSHSWYGSLFEQNINQIVSQLGLFNIKYIVVHKDVPNSFKPFQNVKAWRIDSDLKKASLLENLDKNKAVAQIADNQYFRIYEIFNYNSNVLYISKYNYDIKKFYTPPQLDYKKINPTLYKIDVISNQNQISLAFNQKFDTNWKLIPDNYKNIPLWIKLMTSKFVDGNHHLINNYANEWDISLYDLKNKVSNKDEFEREYGFYLLYKPQLMYQLGQAISILTIISCITILLNRFISGEYGKKN